jgi:cardiolipin synthase
MIQNARKRISVTSPYYVPDETIQMALVTAGSRGLDVELFVSEIGDQFMVYHAQRSYYEQLLRAGVKIYLYRAPTILHAKHLSIDDDVAVIGSSNLDIRSLSLHMELSVLIHGARFTRCHASHRGRLSIQESPGDIRRLAASPQRASGSSTT